MFRLFKFCKKDLFVVLLFLFLIVTNNSHAQNNLLSNNAAERRELHLISGKSVILRSAVPVKRVSIAAPDIADFLLFSSREIYITGKTAGTTNMILWEKGGAVVIYNIEVKYDLSGLKKQLHQILPEEKNIKVIATNDSITLAGKVVSSEKMSQVLAMAGTYAPKGKVNNLIMVGGTHQVMLEVKIAEMDRNSGMEMGINFHYFKPDRADISLGEIKGTMFSIAAFGTNWDAIIDFLKEDGLAKILAKPNLISLSGQTASFLAGGEFPTPVPDEDGISIEYKDYGVGLAFTPTVLSKDKINIKVKSEVSQLDFSTAIQLTGYIVPGLTTRRTETTLELADGQSFAIAGLLQENIKEEATKFPFLGDIPVLGALFRSTSFQKNETELVVIVTPHLIKPLDMAKQSLPTDFYKEPSDVEFYLNMQLPEKADGGQPVIKGRLDGEFGHSVPEVD